MELSLILRSQEVFWGDYVVGVEEQDNYMEDVVMLLTVHVPITSSVVLEHA